ncbi:MAG: hypothetical protein CL908_15490 [Deltaproteobacteria bacterium]|nr:hypothetical protein [Deltaproteobacteria bacterium]
MADADVRAAGFAHCTISQRDDTSEAATPSLSAIANCRGSPLRNEIEPRKPRWRRTGNGRRHRDSSDPNQQRIHQGTDQRRGGRGN